MMTFKELVDKTAVAWANKLIDNKMNGLNDELGLISKDDVIPGLNFDPKEAISEFQRIKDQLPVLKTYADVFGYAKLNETDINAVLTGGINQDQIAKMFGDGETPDVAKIIAKVQLGSVFSVISNAKDMVVTLLDKIGRDTPVDKVNMDDVNYLMTKALNPAVTEMLATDEGVNFLDEVKDEVNDLTDVTASWEKKSNDEQVINIYLNKQRDQFMSSPQTAILTHGAPLNSMRFKAASKIYGIMISLTGKVIFGSTLVEELDKAKNN